MVDKDKIIAELRETIDRKNLELDELREQRNVNHTAYQQARERVAKLEHRLEIDRYWVSRKDAEERGLTIIDEGGKPWQGNLVCVMATPEERLLEGTDKIDCMECTEAHLEECIADRHEAFEAIRDIVETAPNFEGGARIIKIINAFADNGKFYVWKRNKRLKAAEKHQNTEEE